MRTKFILLVVTLARACPLCTTAAVIGTNPASHPLTAERIATLPVGEQPAWREYLARSVAARAADQKFLGNEIKALGGPLPVVPLTVGRIPRLSAARPAEWFTTTDARKMADNVITFQTPAGGWSKNFNAADHARQPGEAFAPHSNLSRFLTPGDNDQPADSGWSYIGTFDNDATIGELRFLAKVIAANPEGKISAPWRAAFARGLSYIFAAQYPHGGWPQSYPLDGGYHDAVTFNDNAFSNIVTLLHDIADGKNEFAFTTPDQRTRASASAARGIACILRAQIVINGRLTVWCQQHDPLTLAPASARNYEMPSKSGSESANLALFLMQLPSPSPEIVRAVHAAAAWFEQTALRDVAFTAAPDGSGRKLQPAPGAGPIWARYYDLKTDRPIFGDRDKTIHDDVNEISAERRKGYSWFGNTAKRMLDHYAKWAKAHPR